MTKLKETSIERTYTLEAHLKKIGDENPEYIDLYATWELDKKTYNSLLMSIIYNYPHYSLHEQSHSTNIISNIEMLLGEDRIRQLGATETWMLLQCAYLHDFGMLLQNKYIETEWQSEDFQEYLEYLAKSGTKDLKEAACYILELKSHLQDGNFEKNWPVKIRGCVVQIVADYFRGKHAKLSRDYINKPDDWNLDLRHNGLIKERLFRLAGEIAFLHGQDFEEVMKLDYKTNGIKSDYIHPRFIAEMIRLGDLLDLDNNRFNLYVCKTYGTLPHISKNHEQKHSAVNHLLITPKYIEVSANCMSEDVYRETRKWFDSLKEEIEKVTIHWTDIVPKCFSGYAPKVSKLEILLKGKKDICEKVDLKFQISQENAFRIIEGSNLYKTKLVFLRELIQNAIDASKMRLWNNIQNGLYSPWLDSNISKEKLTPFDIKDKRIYENYKIEVEIRQIHVKKGPDRIQVKVKDNGIGMSYDDLKNISRVGDSWNKKKNWGRQVKNMPEWLKPTGGFGIGLQSVFLVTNEIAIKTKTENEPCKKIKLISGKDEGYISVIECEDSMAQGTEVTVEFDETIDLGYPVGGYVYERLKNYDSFENQDLPVIWTILEYIGDECRNTLFPVRAKTAEESYAYGNIIENFYDLLRYARHKDPRYLYQFVEDNRAMILWDKDQSALIRLAPLERRKKFRKTGETKICFKGIQVGSNLGFERELANINCDIMGMEAQYTLSLNREKIRKEAEGKINKMLNDAICFALNKTREKILQYPEMLQTNKIHTFNLRLMHDLYPCRCDNDNQEEYFRLLKESSHYTKLMVAEKNPETGKYEEKCINGQRLLEYYPNLSFVDTNKWCLSDNTEIKHENIIEILNANTDIKPSIIIVDEDFSDILKRYPVYSLQKLKWKNCENSYIYSVQNSKAPTGIKTDDYTRHSILTLLGIKDKKRTLIPALREYEALAVKTLTFELKNRCDDESFVLYDKNYYIISPIINTDCKKLKEDITKVSFVSEIQKRRNFQNLLQYTFENHAVRGRYSMDEIEESYIRLMEDYYDVAKNNEEGGTIKGS